MTDRNTIAQVIESLFEDWIDKNINVHPLAVENMRILEADALAMLKEQEAVKPIKKKHGITINCHSCSEMYDMCGKCGNWITDEQIYCEMCGAKIDRTEGR